MCPLVVLGVSSGATDPVAGESADLPDDFSDRLFLVAAHQSFSHSALEALTWILLAYPHRSSDSASCREQEFLLKDQPAAPINPVCTLLVLPVVNILAKLTRPTQSHHVDMATFSGIDQPPSSSSSYSNNFTHNAKGRKLSSAKTESENLKVAPQRVSITNVVSMLRQLQIAVTVLTQSATAQPALPKHLDTVMRLPLSLKFVNVFIVYESLNSLMKLVIGSCSALNSDGDAEELARKDCFWDDLFEEVQRAYGLLCDVTKEDLWLKIAVDEDTLNAPTRYKTRRSSQMRTEALKSSAHTSSSEVSLSTVTDDAGGPYINFICHKSDKTKQQSPTSYTAFVDENMSRGTKVFELTYGVPDVLKGFIAVLQSPLSSVASGKESAHDPCYWDFALSVLCPDVKVSYLTSGVWACARQCLFRIREEALLVEAKLVYCLQARALRVGLQRRTGSASVDELALCYAARTAHLAMQLHHSVTEGVPTRTMQAFLDAIQSLLPPASAARKDARATDVLSRAKAGHILLFLASSFDLPALMLRQTLKLGLQHSGYDRSVRIICGSLMPALITSFQQIGVQHPIQASVADGALGRDSLSENESDEDNNVTGRSESPVTLSGDFSAIVSYDWRLSGAKMREIHLDESVLQLDSLLSLAIRCKDTSPPAYHTRQLEGLCEVADSAGFQIHQLCTAICRLYRHVSELYPWTLSEASKGSLGVDSFCATPVPSTPDSSQQLARLVYRRDRLLRLAVRLMSQCSRELLSVTLATRALTKTNRQIEENAEDAEAAPTCPVDTKQWLFLFSSLTSAPSPLLLLYQHTQSPDNGEAAERIEEIDTPTSQKFAKRKRELLARLDTIREEHRKRSSGSKATWLPVRLRQLVELCLGFQDALSRSSPSNDARNRRERAVVEGDEDGSDSGAETASGDDRRSDFSRKRKFQAAGVSRPKSAGMGRFRTKRQKLRSRNSVIDQWLSEPGSEDEDAYADLEDFLVD